MSKERKGSGDKSALLCVHVPDSLNAYWCGVTQQHRLLFQPFPILPHIVVHKLYPENYVQYSFQLHQNAMIVLKKKKLSRRDKSVNGRHHLHQDELMAQFQKWQYLYLQKFWHLASLVPLRIDTHQWVLLCSSHVPLRNPIKQQLAYKPKNKPYTVTYFCTYFKADRLRMEWIQEWHNYLK